MGFSSPRVFAASTRMLTEKGWVAGAGGAAAGSAARVGASRASQKRAGTAWRIGMVSILIRTHVPGNTGRGFFRFGFARLKFFAGRHSSRLEAPVHVAVVG